MCSKEEIAGIFATLALFINKGYTLVMSTISFKKEEVIEKINELNGMLEEEGSKKELDIERRRELMMAMLLQGIKLNVIR